ncbi:Hint domain-containing protein [Streptomyces sp. NPDC002992]|uniref:Hint domain-containing protein n=1 Tax=Streptomyces sp. NPDC002992 TaxID=3154273 RepID=UPI00339DC857
MAAITPAGPRGQLDSQGPTGGQTSAGGATRTSLALAAADTPGRAAPATWTAQIAQADRADRAVRAVRAGLGNIGVTPMSPEGVGKAYDDLIAQTRSLRGAVDLGVRFDFNQSGNLSCSQTCTVTERVVTSTTAAPGAKLSGTVNASMTAQVTVNGQSGGGCTRSATLPINGSGTMSCVATGTAPVVQRIKAQKQQEAQARARATGRSVRIPYTLNFRAQVQITAMAFAQAEIEQKVGAQQADRGRAVETAKQNAGPNPDCSQDSFVAGTPVLTADASSVPIEDIRVGDAIGNAAPGGRDLRKHTVTGVVATDTDRDFVELTISGSRGSRGTLDPTAHHLFYNVTTATWTRAAGLRPGDRVQTTGAGVATVEAVRPYRATARTYNLSVDGIHTYYVLAADIPVLVHNCAMKKDAKTLKGVKPPRQYEGLDIAHVRQNHFAGGSGVRPGKDLWPSKMTDARLEDIARQALRNNPKVNGFDPETGMGRAVAMVEGKLVQFQFPRGGGPIRSIYPIGFWSE